VASGCRAESKEEQYFIFPFPIAPKATETAQAVQALLKFLPCGVGQFDLGLIWLF